MQSLIRTDFGELLGNLEFGVIHWNLADKQASNWSSVAIHLYGLENAPPSIDAFLSHVAAADRRQVQETVANALKDKGVTQYTYECRPQAVSGRWIRHKGYIHRNSNGRALEIVEVTMDVSDMMRSMNAYMQSEHRRRIITQTISDAIVQLDPDLRILYATPSLEKILGYSEIDVTGGSFLGFCNGEQKQELFRVLAQWADGLEDPPFYEFKARSKKGEDVWLEITGGLCQQNVYSHPSNPSLSLVLCVRDITKQWLYRQSVIDSNAKYIALVERLPSVVYIAEWGENGRWHFVSSKIERLMGYPSHEWMEQPELWYQKMHPEDREWVVAAEERSIRTGEVFRAKYRVYDRCGTLKTIYDEAEPLHGNLMQGIISDISDMENVEKG